MRIDNRNQQFHVICGFVARAIGNRAVPTRGRGLPVSRPTRSGLQPGRSPNSSLSTFPRKQITVAQPMNRSPGGSRESTGWAIDVVILRREPDQEAEGEERPLIKQEGKGKGKGRGRPRKTKSEPEPEEEGYCIMVRCSKRMRMETLSLL